MFRLNRLLWFCLAIALLMLTGTVRAMADDKEDVVKVTTAYLSLCKKGDEKAAAKLSDFKVQNEGLVDASDDPKLVAKAVHDYLQRREIDSYLGEYRKTSQVIFHEKENHDAIVVWCTKLGGNWTVTHVAIWKPLDAWYKNPTPWKL